MLDDAIFAGSIHGLQHHQHGMNVAGPEQFLRFGQFFAIGFEHCGGFLFDRLLSCVL